MINTKDKFKVGVIGAGFVGGAIIQGLETIADIKVYDKHKTQDSFEETCDESEFIFLCLPTPMGKKGKIDLSALNEVLKMLSDRIKKEDNKIIIIKSTITPGTTKKYQSKYSNLTIIHCPEFLTARYARLDWLNANRIVIGGENKEACQRVADLHLARINAPIFITDSTTSEFCKYTCNSFFALKVVFFNQIYEMCQKLGVSYDDIKEIAYLDGRIGRSHMDCPGNDGQFYFGNACFPKDVSEITRFAKKLKCPLTVLEEANRINKEKRPEWYTSF